MKRLLIFFCFIHAFIAANAQWEWHNPQKNNTKKEWYIHNQGWNEDGGNYRRLPLRAKGIVRNKIWDLAGESAGLMLRFRTNATEIKVRYQVTGGYSMPHMPSTGVSGVDLYRKTSGEEPEFCFGNYSFADTIRYAYHIDKQAPTEDEFMLYLPLYNGVKWMEIGVQTGEKFRFIPVEPQKPIILYGTSIAQGACASRPGMAWGNILSRSLEMPLINLGFSGNGKLEKEVIDFINEQEASAIIFDCMANLNKCNAKEVNELVQKAVNQVRNHHNTPIILVEHAGYSNAKTNDSYYTMYTEPNTGQRMAYEELKKKGVKNLYYLSHQELDYHPDSWVDFVHPSDWGMIQQAKAVEKKLKKSWKQAHK